MMLGEQTNKEKKTDRQTDRQNKEARKHVVTDKQELMNKETVHTFKELRGQTERN